MKWFDVYIKIKYSFIAILVALELVSIISILKKKTVHFLKTLVSHLHTEVQ